ncbi:MarR family winged helix-turn-helix transcriptional regulator [Plantactinospora sp. WMMC1484]|uniref:MarR family winged helix-turn-helix transcriptional regulator n=1 Tax=Plantactinospora sp. WMMC1484 TaxID=3404122 RepID=UPI003BF460A0
MENRMADSPPDRLTALPSWLLTQTARHAQRLVGDGFAAVDARGYHYRLLLTLDETGPTSQADLGRRSGIHLSDVVAAVNDLADRQLVERSPDPTDRRRNVITLTPAGRRQLRRLDRAVARIQDDLLAPLTPTERDQLTRLLTRLLHHHNAGEARKRVPETPR